MDFVLNEPVGLEESLTCEFKEIKSQPIHVVGKTVDEYVVAFLNEAGGSIFWGVRDDRVVTGFAASDKLRDELRQVIGQKLAAIAPPLPGALVNTPFHAVRYATGDPVPDTCVLEVRVAKPEGPGLFLTGSGEAYRKTLGGTKKLSGAELFLALAPPLQAKLSSKAKPASLIAEFPAAYRRFELVQPLIRGKRVLWVDDQPSNNFYERLALSQAGLIVDVATNSDEGWRAATHLHPEVIVSDIARDGQHDAGLRFLRSLRAAGISTPLIFYVGQVIETKGVPPGAFGITDRPDEVLHLVLDVLERATS